MGASLVCVWQRMFAACKARGGVSLRVQVMHARVQLGLSMQQKMSEAYKGKEWVSHRGLRSCKHRPGCARQEMYQTRARSGFLS